MDSDRRAESAIADVPGGGESCLNTPFLWAICLVAAMGGLLFGYDWVVIGGAKLFYEPYFGISDQQPLLQSVAMSSALFGCLGGTLVAGALSDWLGRKRLLLFSGLLFTVSAVWTALCGDFTTFLVARIIGGVGIGLASNLSPVYIAEVSPARVRGRFVSINQLTITIGVLAAQVVNMLIADPVPTGATTQSIVESWNGQSGWRWMFGAEAVPACLFFVLMFLVPESPRWLVKSGYPDRALRVLSRIGGAAYARAEVSDIEATLSSQEISRVRFGDLLAPKLLKVLALGVFLAVFQQWCGINVIFNYAQEVFSDAGYGVSDILLNIVITGVVSLLFTVVAIFIVDRLGRRPLMLIGAGGLAVIYVILGAGYYTQSQGVHMLILVVCAIACYTMTLAPITWVIISEIFPNRIRGAAMAVSVFALWVACTLLTFTFPLLKDAVGAHGAFWLYGAICAVGFVVILLRLPETKGKSLEQIERELVD